VIPQTLVKKREGEKGKGEGKERTEGEVASCPSRVRRMDESRVVEWLSL